MVAVSCVTRRMSRPQRSMALRSKSAREKLMGGVGGTRGTKARRTSRWSRVHVSDRLGRGDGGAVRGGGGGTAQEGQRALQLGAEEGEDALHAGLPVRRQSPQ